MTKKFISKNDIDFDIISENLLSNDEEDSSSEEMLDDIFPLYEDNINRDDLSIYSNKKSPAKKKVFIVTESSKHITQFTKKKRGKQPKLNIDNKKIHDRYSLDNVLAKVKNHSLSLVPPFLNDILKALFIEEEFYQLSHKFKKTIKNNYFSEAKKKTLGEIICNKISPKYSLLKKY